MHDAMRPCLECYKQSFCVSDRSPQFTKLAQCFDILEMSCICYTMIGGRLAYLLTMQLSLLT